MSLPDVVEGHSRQSFYGVAVRQREETSQCSHAAKMAYL